MNWVDLVVLGVLGLSALLAFSRGFVREALGIGSWVGAGLFAHWSFPFVVDKFHGWIAEPQLADIAALAAMFLLGNILLSYLAGMIGKLVRASDINDVDRTLGLVFGLARGAILVAVAYIAGSVVGVDNWPPVVLQARTLPYAYQGAVTVTALLPPNYRPSLQPPPKGRDVSAEDYMRKPPVGRAIGK